MPNFLCLESRFYYNEARFKNLTRIIHFNFLFVILTFITNNSNGRNTFYHFSCNQKIIPHMYLKSMLGVCIRGIPFIYMSIIFYLTCDFMAVIRDTDKTSTDKASNGHHYSYINAKHRLRVHVRTVHISWSKRVPTT